MRLKDYDYSREGAYFLTLCIENRHEILSQIVGAGFSRPLETTLPNEINVSPNETITVQLSLSPYGNIVERYIKQINIKYPHADIDKYVIMPNHVHMILVISNDTGSGRENPAPTVTVSSIVGWLKYHTTVEMNDLNGGTIEKIWQRSYHDHIIRNKNEHEEIWQYIENNPLKWEQDKYYIL